MYSNAYIFKYATIMVILVAAILSTAAMLLKPFQEKNIKRAKMEGILASARLRPPSEKVLDKYKEYIVVELLIDSSGNIISKYEDGKFIKGDIRPFDVDMKKQIYNANNNKHYVLPLFIAKVDHDSVYVVPLYGKGLWGPIWGNMALTKGFNEVYGVDFGHKSETPGLGAEINTMDFQEQFYGKTIFDPDGDFESIKVVKGGINRLPEEMRIHGVDAISGGTITSNGVSEMLNDCLKLYIPFVKKHIR